MLPIECVVRGYLSGSGWRGLRVHRRRDRARPPRRPAGAEQLPEPIFTPSTKAHEGHDEDIDADRAAELVGRDLLDQVERTALALYTYAAEYARERGIVIADTKFEFGFDFPTAGSCSATRR